MLNPIVLGALIGAVAVLGGRWLYTKDTEKEERRRAASKLAGVLRAGGLEHVPQFLEDYSVGDYSGMAKEIKKAALLLENPKHAEELFDAMADKVAAARAAKLAVVKDG